MRSTSFNVLGNVYSPSKASIIYVAMCECKSLFDFRNNLYYLKNKKNKKFWEGNIVIKHLMGYCEISHSLKVWSIRWWWHDPGFSGWNFTPSSRDRLDVEIKLGPVKAGQFSTWHLFRFACNIFDFFFVTMSVYETEIQ